MSPRAKGAPAGIPPVAPIAPEAKQPARTGPAVVDGTCPHCGHVFELPPAGQQGQMVTCHDCRSEFSRARYMAPEAKQVKRIGTPVNCGRCGTKFAPKTTAPSGERFIGCPTCGLPAPGQPTYNTLEQQNAAAV